MERYTATIRLNLFAGEEDEAAIKEAEKIIKQIRNIKGQEENEANILELHRTPFGSLKPEKIELK